MIEIYTDGGCSGNPGPGGWAFVLTAGNNVIKKSGGEEYTTNNKMELTAVIKALKEVQSESSWKGEKVVVVTDSQYVKNGITSWIKSWIKNGWMTSAKKPVKNKEYWIELKSLTDVLPVEWRWVKGHAGNELNEECDTMVGLEMDKYRK
ncbi:MAG: ribonuclease HI [Spirochaetales bacterium]|nr:ribonuclease HI [Spirochaetales bacterium]